MKEHASLTARQRAVLALVATGATNAEIAAALGLSRQTVRDHISRAYARLGTSGRPGRMHAALAVVAPPVPLAGCLVFANRESALAALGGER